MQERTAWALKLEQDLHHELEDRTAWALSLESQLNERTAWAFELQSGFEERTTWALNLDREVRNLRARLNDLQAPLLRRVLRRLRRVLR